MPCELPACTNVFMLNALFVAEFSEAPESKQAKYCVKKQEVNMLLAECHKLTCQCRGEINCKLKTELSWWLAANDAKSTVDFRAGVFVTCAKEFCCLKIAMRQQCA